MRKYDEGPWGGGRRERMTKGGRGGGGEEPAGRVVKGGKEVHGEGG